MKTYMAVSCLICAEMHYLLLDLECPSLFLHLQSRFTICALHEWLSGRILACHAGDRDSIPYLCIWLLAVSVRRGQIHNWRLVCLIWRGSGSKSYIGQQHNQSVSVPPNSAMRWHSRLISERWFRHRQFRWSATDEVMSQTWFFGGVLIHSGEDEIVCQCRTKAGLLLFWQLAWSTCLYRVF